MSLIDRLANRLGYTKVSNLEAPEWALASADRLRYSGPDQRITYNHNDLYRRLSWVNMAVRLVSDSAATTPLSVKQRTGEGAVDIENHPFELLLQQPNPLTPRHEFLYATFAYRQLTGNAYWWVNAPSDNSPVTELWIIPPDKLEPIPDGKLYIAGYKYTDGSYEVRIPREQIVHFKRFNPINPFVGLSVIESLAAIAVGDMKMQEWNTNYFAKDHAKPAGALAFADPIRDQDWERLKDELREKHGGTARNLMMLRNAGKGGVQWLSMALSQKDMEFLAGRRANREEIFLAFGVPLGLLSENATEANATIAKAVYSEFGLWPQLVSMAETITTALLPRYGQGLLAQFEDIRISDQQLELAQRQTWATYRTIDELRSEDGLEPIGDERGQMLAAEIAKSLAPINGSAPQLPSGEPPAPEAAPPMPDDEADLNAPDNSMLKAVEELRLWRKKSLRALGDTGLAVCAFRASHIPASIQNEVAASLLNVEDKEMARAVFAKAIDRARTSGNAPDTARRKRLENKLAKTMQAYFADQQKRILSEAQKAKAASGV